MVLEMLNWNYKNGIKTNIVHGLNNGQGIYTDIW